jgi:hypothetical protein
VEPDAEDLDSSNLVIEDVIAKLTLELMENECDRLEELIAAADEVAHETKIETIVNSVRQLPAGESVLFFTEYKVTQALLISTLWREFGEQSATFINGDNALVGVLSPDGRRRDLRETRESAKDRFNSGAVRFLVSTEAAGEGVDLQERCSRLIHVDLPWNPMRLHQRVGRLNRIGQREIVKVMLFQNPDTVESRIWTLLNEKLERITRSINAVTEEPEDMHQLVLGIAGPSVLDPVFSQADAVPRAKLAEWFDQQTGQLGGQDSVRVVQDLIGHAQHFAHVSEHVPKLDLPDLAPFFRLALRYNRRQITESGGALAFKTPDAWLRSAGVRPRYTDVLFSRKLSAGEKGMTVGVGNRLFDTALEQARKLLGTHTVVADELNSGLLFIYRCFDRITGNPGQPQGIICGVFCDGATSRTLKDWEVLSSLNRLAGNAKSSPESESEPAMGAPGSSEALKRAEVVLREYLPALDLPFRQPDLELMGS